MKRPLLGLLLLTLPVVVQAQCTDTVQPVGSQEEIVYEEIFHQDWSEYPIGHLFETTWGGLPMRVVDPDLPGWPDRALEIRYNGQANVGGESGWPIPGVGESITYSLLLYVDMPGTVGIDHGMQSNLGNISHAWTLGIGMGESPDPRTQFGLGFQSYSSWDGAIWYNAALPQTRSLRVQWTIDRTSELGYRASILVTDIGNGTTWDSSTFLDNYGAGRGSIEGVDLTLGDPDDLGQYLFGTSGSGLRGGNRVLIGDFRVSEAR